MKNKEDPPLKGWDCLVSDLEGVSDSLQNMDLKNPGLKAGVSPISMNSIFVFLICFCSLICASMVLTADTVANLTEQADRELLICLQERVSETIQNSGQIPGLKDEEFIAMQAEIGTVWKTLSQYQLLLMHGMDQQVRPYFVALQGIVEHVLASSLQKDVKRVSGYIHTPMPATPLCTKGEISSELIHPSLENDPARIFTVKARVNLLRDYLYKGGDLYMIYPKNGYNRRTAEQQQIYLQELQNYPNHLFDTPLDCDSIPDELIGATYFLEDSLGKIYVFAIKMTQANDPRENREFGLWFGPLEHPCIQMRVKEVGSFLAKQGISFFESLP